MCRYPFVAADILTSCTGIAEKMIEGREEEEGSLSSARR